MKDRLLSVIITAYNAENTIERCVASVFESTPCELVKLLEIIVVDDASEDKTTDKLNSFTDRIELVRLQTNSGCIAKTRNIGLDYASGKYITFLDSDDWYENGAVGKILGYISEYSPDIIRFGYTNVYPGGKREIPKSNPSKLEFISGREMNRKIYPQFITGIGLNSVCLAAFKRELSVHRFPENFLTAEDAAFSIETYTKAANVLLVPDALYCYYQSGQGLTGAGMGIIKKYRYNFMLVPLMLGKLPKWGLNSPQWKIRTVLRPLRLTVDKLKRSKF